MKLLQEWGYEVHAAASPDGRWRDELEALGVTCWDIPFTRSPSSPKNLTAYRALKALLRKERFALIHVHTPVASLLGRLAAKCVNQGPVLYTAHGFHFYRGAPWLYWLLYYPIEKLASPWTDGLIVMNSEDYERAQRMGFRAGENLFLVHGVGVDIDRFAHAEGESVRKSLGIGSGEVVVTYVAEFTPTKNHEMFLEAWSKVEKESERIHLLLVGEGKMRPKIEAKAKPLRRVQFLGFRNDVPQIFHASDLVVQVSKREGLPRSVMEAMAAGKPVVATDVRGNRDLVHHGVNGFLVKLGDVEALAEAILKLAYDPDLRQRMGRASQEIIKDYSLERVLEEMASIYRKYLRE